MFIHEAFFYYDQLIVDSNSNSLEKIINWFEGLQQPFIPRLVWLECLTMLGEAVDNVLVHAHDKLPQNTPIDIEVIILSQLIILKIWDFGSGFNIKNQKIQILKGIDFSAENGRGIKILEQGADYIDYVREEQKNYLLIIKNFVPLPTTVSPNQLPYPLSKKSS